MELKFRDRLNILKQGIQIAQSKGVFTLDDAVYIKSALDIFERPHKVDEANPAMNVILNAVQVAQTKGAYTLKDAYLIYIASNGIKDCFVCEGEPDSPTPSETCDKEKCDKEN